MKLKINWGGGIVIAITVMVTGMLVLVFIATRQDYYLVDKDYYLKAVNYQQQINKIQNANSLTEKVNITYSGESLKIVFPSLFKNEALEGDIKLYSPVNDNYDTNYPLKLDSSLTQTVSLGNLPQGRYKVKLNWSTNHKGFYQELEIMHK